MGREENGKKERGREGGKARQGERERERISKHNIDQRQVSQPQEITQIISSLSPWTKSSSNHTLIICTAKIYY